LSIDRSIGSFWFVSSSIDRSTDRSIDFLSCNARAASSWACRRRDEECFDRCCDWTSHEKKARPIGSIDRKKNFVPAAAAAAAARLPLSPAHARIRTPTPSEEIKSHSGNACCSVKRKNS
jgi:hypothetical protein